MDKINVCLRVRPLNHKEISEGEQKAWEIHDSRIQLNKTCLKELMQQKKVLQNLSYEFNHCYDHSADNYFLFQTSVKQLVLQALDGINGTIMMYGQTGSGKTFTMLGAKNSEMQAKESAELQHLIKDSLNRSQYNDIGILVYSMMELFKQINKDQKRQFEVKCSYYEIYNENIYDLLKSENEVSDPLIFGTDYRKEFVIKNLKEASVTSLDDMFRLLQTGEANRHYAETILNHQSSRSHTVFKVLISAYQNESEDDENFTFSTEACINFIDLAGSEKINAAPISDEAAKNSARKERNKESSSINKSLFFLTRVIALKTQKVPPSHIPYRNSTLTKLLKSSFTGNFKTLIILSINPGISHYDQTNSTLRFGMSAKLVEQRVEQNTMLDPNNPQNQQKLSQLLLKVRLYEKQISEQQQTITDLKSQLGQDFSIIDKSQSPIMEFKQSVSQFSETDISQYEKVKELQIQLQQEYEKNQMLEKNCSEMHKRLLKSNEQILIYFNSHKTLEDQLNEYRDQNNRLQKLTQQALNRLSCYEGNLSFLKISNEEIKNLEQQLEKTLSQIREEKQRRNSFQLNNFENSHLITQQSDQPTRSERSSASSEKKKQEEHPPPLFQNEEVPKPMRKTPQKESRPRLQVKQHSYFRQSGSYLLKSDQRSAFTKNKTPLRGSREQALRTETDQPKEIKSFRATSSHESGSKSAVASPQKKEDYKNDLMTLADRLYNLSEKFEHKKEGRGSANNKYLQNMKKSEIIFETDSEVAPDSKSSLLGQKQNRSAYK